MNVSELIPQPTSCETFRRSRERFVPEKAGCYVLATFTKIVLYVGLTANLRRRMNSHLDSPEKTGLSPSGRASFFFWVESEEINKIERTWLNIHIQHEGRLPELNAIYSPTST